MLPAESVFANIKTFLSATKVTVATIRDLEELKEWVASIFGSNEGVESTVSLENAGMKGLTYHIQSYILTALNRSF